jgi:hypothetical protein
VVSKKSVPTIEVISAAEITTVSSEAPMMYTTYGAVIGILSRPDCGSW